MTRAWPSLLALLTLFVGGAGGYALARVAGSEPPPVEACGGTQRMVRLQLSPALEALVDQRRGDRWVVFEAKEVPRQRLDGGTSSDGAKR